MFEGSPSVPQHYTMLQKTSDSVGGNTQAYIPLLWCHHNVQIVPSCWHLTLLFYSIFLEGEGVIHKLMSN